MLLTRCPECDTTFRVTEETLKKASGQVRCGRCASVFNAYAELQDSDAKPVEADAPRSHAKTSAPAERRPEPKPAAPSATVRLETKRAEAAVGVSLGTTSVADVIAET